MRSIKWKLVAIYLGLVFMVMIISGTFIILSLRSQEQNKIKGELAQYVLFLRQQVIGTEYADDRLQLILDEATKRSPIYNNKNYVGAILNDRGETIASTEKTGGMLPQFNNQTIISVLSGEKNAFSPSKWENDSMGLLKEWVSYAESAEKEGIVKYVIYVRTDAQDIKNSLSRTTNAMVLTLVIALTFTIVVGYIFASTLTGPISILTAKAKELAMGNLNQQITVRSKDEIGQLTESFNYMAKELSITVNEIQNEKNKLEIILNNMTDGVLSFDDVGSMVHANPASYEILGLDKAAAGINYRQIIKKYNINSGVVFDIKANTTKEVSFSYEDRYIKASFAPYSNEQGGNMGIVVVLQDITEQRKLDEMRKEFVANVSHELRTPLTTVKSYAETLIEGAMEQKDIAKDFLMIINSETDRMAALVTDLLKLSKFDNQQFNLEIMRINVKRFLEEKVSQNKIHADNKGQQLVLEPVDSKDFIFADPDRATQVLNNIIINAIKYSPQNSKIVVSVNENSQSYQIIVTDNGMGIPKEDISRIFERFYRVDKARSRQMGGTGLGLAIAQEIMIAHKGKITVTSEINAGTTMIMHFPKAELNIKKM